MARFTPRPLWRHGSKSSFVCKCFKINYLRQFLVNLKEAIKKGCNRIVERFPSSPRFSGWQPAPPANGSGHPGRNA